jgi:hypothetical protein
MAQKVLDMAKILKQVDTLKPGEIDQLRVQIGLAPLWDSLTPLIGPPANPGAVPPDSIARFGKTASQAAGDSIAHHERVREEKK